MEPEISLPCSKESSTGTYPEPDESSPYNSTLSHFRRNGYKYKLSVRISGIRAEIPTLGYLNKETVAIITATFSAFHFNITIGTVLEAKAWCCISTIIY
jgi:hypothetical protein